LKNCHWGTPELMGCNPDQQQHYLLDNTKPEQTFRTFCKEL
jgi:hypothetical protein